MTATPVAVVVVPARDEASRIEECLRALGDQVRTDPASYEVIVVLHRCVDATASVVARLAGTPGIPRVRTVACLEGGVGHARRLGMDLAADLLEAAGHHGGLIATTDADTVVAPDWLDRQLEAIAAGACAVGGMIELCLDEAAALPAGVLEERAARADSRMAAVRATPGGEAAEHHFFSGASIGLTVETYRRVGGMPPLDSLEDEALGRALAAAGVPITRSAAVRVTTSARRRGRAPRGLANDLAVSTWRTARTYLAEQFGDLDELVAQKTCRVSVVFPARQEAATIAAVVDAARSLADVGLVDEVLVVDAASSDGTAARAAAAGATVYQENDLLTQFGPCMGKGDAMWRSQAVTTGDVVCFVDADTSNFSPSFIAATVAPLVLDPGLAMSKGTFARPLQVGEIALAGEGGRVTELAARPVINLLFPELAGFDQPLAGEVAVRRDVLAGLALPVGYGVEIAMLIDVWRERGLDALCQVDLGTRQNRHQSLRELSAMAYAVLVAAAGRSGDLSGIHQRGLGPLLLPSLVRGAPSEVRHVPVAERPPFASLGPAGSKGDWAHREPADSK